MIYWATVVDNDGNINEFYGQMSGYGAHVLFLPIEDKCPPREFENETLAIMERVNSQDVNFEHLRKSYSLMYRKAQEATTNRWGLVTIFGGTLSIMPKYETLSVFDVEIVPTPQFWLHSEIKEFDDHYATETWFGDGSPLRFFGFHGTNETYNPASEDGMFENLELESVIPLAVWLWHLSRGGYFHVLLSIGQYYITTPKNAEEYFGVSLPRTMYICPTATRMLQYHPHVDTYTLFVIQFLFLLRLFVNDYNREWKTCVCFIDRALRKTKMTLPAILDMLRTYERRTFDDLDGSLGASDTASILLAPGGRLTRKRDKEQLSVGDSLEIMQTVAYTSPTDYE